MAFFSIPARGDEALQENLNGFLRAHRVLTMRKELVGQGDNSFWALAVEYLNGATSSGSGQSGLRKNRVDYKEILLPLDFAIFARLREWRKAVAEKEAVPVYTLFTNEQLAQIVLAKPGNKSQLQEIEGVGKAKTAKYGGDVLAILNAAAPTDKANTIMEADTPRANDNTA